MSSSPSSASSSGSESSPSPRQRRIACNKRPNRKWTKSYSVKRLRKKDSPTGRHHKAYEVKGRCAKVKTAWMALMAATWKLTQKSGMSYKDTMDVAKVAYDKYKKTHMTSSGHVRSVPADIAKAAKDAHKAAIQ